jgi:hypothetical protein
MDRGGLFFGKGGRGRHRSSMGRVAVRRYVDRPILEMSIRRSIDMHAWMVPESSF